MVQLTFEYVPVIARSPSGKRRYFVDGRQTASFGKLAGSLVEEKHHVLTRSRRTMHWVAATGVAVAVAIAVLMTMSLPVPRKRAATWKFGPTVPTLRSAT